MSYRIAGVDVHKKILAVVVSDVEIESEYQFERKMFGAPTTDSSERANLAPPAESASPTELFQAIDVLSIDSLYMNVCRPNLT